MTLSLVLLGFQTGNGFEVGRQCGVFLQRADIGTPKHYLGQHLFRDPSFDLGFRGQDPKCQHPSEVEIPETYDTDSVVAS